MYCYDAWDVIFFILMGVLVSLLLWIIGKALGLI